MQEKKQTHKTITHSYVRWTTESRTRLFNRNAHMRSLHARSLTTYLYLSILTHCRHVRLPLAASRQMKRPQRDLTLSKQLGVDAHWPPGDETWLVYEDCLWTESKVVFTHAVKAYRRSKGTAPLILNLGTTWRRMVYITSWPPYAWHALNTWVCGPQSRCGRLDMR
jgi:hypothetical protein